MGEIKKFPGQPILSQILELIPGQLIHAANRKHKANRYYKTLSFRVHLVSMLFGVFSYCNGLRELCEGLLACEGKLSHLGLDKAPARSTLSDANSNRHYQVFETIYYGLLRQYHSFISDSRLKGLSIRNLKVIDRCGPQPAGWCPKKRRYQSTCAHGCLQRGNRVYSDYRSPGA